MSDKQAGAMSVFFVVLALLGFVLSVVSAWAHQPAGIIYGLMILTSFAGLGVKMWGTKS